VNLRTLELAEWAEALAPVAPSPTAVRKLFARVHAHGALDVEALQGTVQVPRRVLDYLLERAQMPSLTVIERRRAADGFVKYLFESPRGGRVEAVRIPLFESKYVICVSSQVGCALACAFCATGRMGFRRNLETWEILEQVRWIREEADRRISGVVFMGMGEPLLNAAQVVRAARILAHPAGYAISGRAITLSTAGVVPAIHRYVRQGHPYRLAFSVTSALPAKRAQVMPVEETHPLPDLIEAIRFYATERRERAMVAYVCIGGFNTGREDAEALHRAFQGIPIRLDLIEVADPTGRFLPPSPSELARFRDHLQILGAPVVRRYSGGREIGAACGTLEASSYGGIVLSG
jgi:23S rRNA (adenine2503-C2)-methyltransferase